MSHRTRARSRKIAAILAGVAVLGVGTVATLATWQDSEWVFGGLDGGAGVGTSTFEVQQNTTGDETTGDVDSNEWTDEESNPGGALTFTTGALALTPGDSIYAPVALQTTSDSVAGDVTLQAAVAASGVAVNDDGGDLWAAMTQSVVTSTDPFACNEDAFSGADPLTPFAAGALGDTATTASSAQSLAAASGSTQYYCFKLTFTDDANDSELQGLTIAPAWEFKSVSTAS